jgi:TldD protein
MFKLASKAIEIADKYGAEFGDIRVIEDRRQRLGVRNGEIAAMSDTTTLGYGIRVLYKGA